MEIPMLGTDALPHVKLNPDIPAQILKMFNLYAQRYAEMVTCKVHNQRYVMTEILLIQMAAKQIAKLVLDIHAVDLLLYAQKYMETG